MDDVLTQGHHHPSVQKRSKKPLRKSNLGPRPPSAPLLKEGMTPIRRLTWRHPEGHLMRPGLHSQVHESVHGMGLTIKMSLHEVRGMHHSTMVSNVSGKPAVTGKDRAQAHWHQVTAAAAADPMAAAAAEEAARMAEAAAHSAAARVRLSRPTTPFAALQNWLQNTEPDSELAAVVSAVETGKQESMSRAGSCKILDEDMSDKDRHASTAGRQGPVFRKDTGQAKQPVDTSARPCHSMLRPQGSCNLAAELRLESVPAAAPPCQQQQGGNGGGQSQSLPAAEGAAPAVFKPTPQRPALVSRGFGLHSPAVSLPQLFKDSLWGAQTWQHKPPSSAAASALGAATQPPAQQSIASSAAQRGDTPFSGGSAWIVTSGASIPPAAQHTLAFPRYGAESSSNRGLLNLGNQQGQSATSLGRAPAGMLPDVADMSHMQPGFLEPAQVRRMWEQCCNEIQPPASLQASQTLEQQSQARSAARPPSIDAAMPVLAGPQIMRQMPAAVVEGFTALGRDMAAAVRAEGFPSASTAPDSRGRAGAQVIHSPDAALYPWGVLGPRQGDAAQVAPGTGVNQSFDTCAPQAAAQVPKWALGLPGPGSGAPGSTPLQVGQEPLQSLMSPPGPRVINITAHAGHMPPVPSPPIGGSQLTGESPQNQHPVSYRYMPLLKTILVQTALICRD